MKIQIEEIIKKNLPEKKEMKGITDYFDSDGGFNQALSQINTSLIADEVLKVVKENLPNEQIHTLPDDVNSPHETEFDSGWNSYRRKLLSNLSHNKEN